MTTFEITYKRTGRTGAKETDFSKVWINTGDERKDGSKVHNMIDAIEFFEELAESWGSYENKNAIREIKVVREI